MLGNGVSIDGYGDSVHFDYGEYDGSEVGFIIGWNEGTASNNVSGASLPTIYNVVNGLSDGDSEYWSNNNFNEVNGVQAPKLKWEK